MPSEHQCPKCGAVLPVDAPKGLCPRCLMAAALEQSRPAAGKPTIRVEPDAGEEPIEKIDRYKILQKLGEGGCGVVYMAEQTEPVRRKVALKVIKLGMDTKQVIARFEAERQALALMDHPNIAKVLDAGATATGRPYFVMELVKGIRITDYCDQNHLSTMERLGLFTQVCQAIQHAHQKGIIHRDIKPSNILVTLHDGKPVPKVIDFGIAKATEQPLTEKTVFTAFGQFMGTPAYMSPEQAELSGLDIDTRSDIYALGVLLYELLTGRTPFDAKELLQAGLDEMRRRIREEEPVRPSTRLSIMVDADLTEVAEQRRSEPAKLTRFIRGDLDWIVMKCLEKDRTRRYETANGLAMDLRRHLNNEPVLACPPSAAYRFQKMVRRNKLAVAAVSAVVAALVIGLGIATWQFFEKSKALNRAVAAENQANNEASKNMLGMALWGRGDFDSAEPLFREQLTIVRKSEGTNSPNMASMLSNVSTLLRDLGRLDEAETMSREALAMRQKLLGNQYPTIAYSQYNLAIILERQNKLAEAETLHRSALPLLLEKLGTNHQYVAESLSDLAVVLAKMGETVAAEAMQRDALAAAERALGKENEDAADSLDRLGILLAVRDDLAGSETLLTNALVMMRKLVGYEDPDVIPSLWHLSWVLKQRGNLTAAETLHREATTISLEGGNYSIRALTESCYDLVDLLQVQNRFVDAEPLLLDAFTYLKSRPSAHRFAQRDIRERLVHFYETWDHIAPNPGKQGEIAVWRGRLEELKSLPIQKQN